MGQYQLCDASHGCPTGEACNNFGMIGVCQPSQSEAGVLDAIAPPPMMDAAGMERHDGGRLTPPSLHAVPEHLEPAALAVLAQELERGEEALPTVVYLHRLAQDDGARGEDLALSQQVDET